MKLQKSELVGIVGAMASGKSTLISALSGEIRKIRGVFQLNDQIIHVPNSPWLKTGTIRENILFGSGGSGSSNGSDSNNSNTLSLNYKTKLYDKVRNQKKYVKPETEANIMIFAGYTRMWTVGGPSEATRGRSDLGEEKWGEPERRPKAKNQLGEGRFQERSHLPPGRPDVGDRPVLEAAHL